jgi:hypothetical protein
LLFRKRKKNKKLHRNRFFFNSRYLINYIKLAIFLLK